MHNSLIHPLPFYIHTATGRVLYIATGPCPLVFSISLNDVGKHAPLVDKATHPFSQSTSVDSLATDTVRREFGGAMALESGPLDETLCLWATFCDDVADRLNNDAPLAEALDDTWMFGLDVDLDDDPAAASIHGNSGSSAMNPR